MVEFIFHYCGKERKQLCDQIRHTMERKHERDMENENMTMGMRQRMDRKENEHKLVR